VRQWQDVQYIARPMKLLASRRLEMLMSMLVTWRFSVANWVRERNFLMILGQDRVP
jgi:hypothetical protein